MNAEEYAAIERRWTELWESTNPGGDWRTPWLNTHGVNGERIADSNPVFSAVSDSLQRAVRVIDILDEPGPFSAGCRKLQYGNELVEIVWWNGSFGDPEYDDVISELVINVRRTPASERMVVEMLDVWVKTGKVPDKYLHYT